jgi:hypothetical protein
MESASHPAHATVPPAFAQPRTLGLFWPLTVADATSAGVMALALPAGVQSDADTYWHLAAGRWIVEHGRVPDADPFSHSMPGASWTAREWLAVFFLGGVQRLSLGVIGEYIAKIYLETKGRSRYVVERST